MYADGDRFQILIGSFLKRAHLMSIQEPLTYTQLTGFEPLLDTNNIQEPPKVEGSALIASTRSDDE